MRAWSSKVLVAVAGTLLAAGAGGLINAYQPVQRVDTPTIPAGAEWFVAYEFSILGSGKLWPEFQVTSTGLVNFYVFTEAQFNAYVSTGVATSAMWDAPASADSGEGAFSILLSESGRYFVAFEHSGGFENTAQTLQVSIRVEGIQPLSLIIGIASLAAGIPMLVVGLVLARRLKRASVGSLNPPLPPQD